jgi:hypothetical protein
MKQPPLQATGDWQDTDIQNTRMTHSLYACPPKSPTQN